MFYMATILDSTSLGDFRIWSYRSNLIEVHWYTLFLIIQMTTFITDPSSISWKAIVKEKKVYGTLAFF